MPSSTFSVCTDVYIYIYVVVIMMVIVIVKLFDNFYWSD